MRESAAPAVGSSSEIPTTDATLASPMLINQGPPTGKDVSATKRTAANARPPAPPAQDPRGSNAADPVSVASTQSEPSAEEPA